MPVRDPPHLKVVFSFFVVSHTKESHGLCVMDVKRYMMTSVDRTVATTLYEYNTKPSLLDVRGLEL